MPSIIGPDGNVCGGTISLEGSGCEGAIYYEWTLQKSPQGSTAAIANPNALSTTVAYDVDGEYVFKLCCFFEKVPE